jgi:homoserine kinase type II
MAVYTHVSAEAMAAFLERFDVGQLVSAKGIAEGVQNSNYLLETTQARFILTLYESRVNQADLPYFLGLMNHLAADGMPVPRAVADRQGTHLQDVCGRKACLIEFLSGVSVSDPTPLHAHAVGVALAQMRQSSATFNLSRANDLSLHGWQHLADECRTHADDVEPGLAGLIDSSLHALAAAWPTDLPTSAIHADLFPDNVLFLGDAISGPQISGLIDFYFACNDSAVYDLAVCFNAWGFDASGQQVHHTLMHALQQGYESVQPLSDAERQALPILSQGAALRFLLSRLYDWVNTPKDALVTRKDPLAYARRLRWWQQQS